MHRSSLIELLKTFSKQEMKDFGEYVHSPFFNKNKSVSRLYAHIRKYYPELKDDKIEKEYTFKKIYNTAKYNDTLMRGTMFRLSKLAEDFIAFNQYKINAIEEKKFLLKELRNLMEKTEEVLNRIVA